MQRTYNRIAGGSVERVAALSDGLFAVAMTLIVLEIRVPEHVQVHTEPELWRALVARAPQALTYLTSFLTLGIFWVGQQTQLSHLARSDRNLTWIHLAFLSTVAGMPFSTALLARFITFRLAVVVYWANLLLLGLLLYATWVYASRAGLVKADAPAEIDRAILRRIRVAQTLYAISVALCLVDTWLSIGFIFLVQLNYAIAPRLPWLSRT